MNPSAPTRRSPRAVIVALAAGAALLLIPAVADASVATRSGSTITVTANPGESNSITFTSSYAGARIEDTAGIAPADASCTTQSPTEVLCGASEPGLTAVVSLGDGNDTLRLDLVETIPSVDADGGPGNDDIGGSSHADVIRGGDGNDTIFGGNGNDQLDGGAGDDSVKGSSADDVVIGGPGQDALDGDGSAFVASHGNDRIYSRDGERDQVACGAAADIVVADALDAVDMVNCEQVDITGGGAPAPTPTPGQPAPPALSVGIIGRPTGKISTLASKGYSFRARFSAACTATYGLVLRADEARRLRLGRAEVVLKADAAAVPGAGTYSASTIPKARFRARLRAQRRVTVFLVITCADAAGTIGAARKRIVFRS